MLLKGSENTLKISRKKGPLYLQIKRILKDRILHGIYPIDGNLPPEPQLESEFNVSKITVRKAIQELVQEGYLITKSGKGTTVIRNTSTSMLSKGKLFTEYLVEEGHQIHKKLLKLEKIKNPVDSKLFHFFGERCYCVHRIYLLNNIPYIYFTHYLSLELDNIDQDYLRDHSLYETIEENEIVLQKFQDHFAVSTAPPDIEDTLGVAKGSPLLKRLRYSFDETNRLIEYSEGYYNTDMQQYVLNYES